MSFPITSAFQGLKGLLHITVTADQDGTPEIVHFADEAGASCAHLALEEWDKLSSHIAGLLHYELETEPATAPAPGPDDAPPVEPLGGALTDPDDESAPQATSDAPFLAPAEPAETAGA